MNQIITLQEKSGKDILKIVMLFSMMGVSAYLFTAFSYKLRNEIDNNFKS